MAFFLLLPLLGFLFFFVARQRVNSVGIAIGAGITFLGLLVSISQFFSKTETAELSFVWANFSTIKIAFYADHMGKLMLVLVHLIAVLVQIFSISYMKSDPNRWRYVAYLQLFIFSMLGLVLSKNLLTMYVFWELVGLSSYLLIGFWHNKPKAVWAAKKAFIFNRIGDVGFLVGILWLISLNHSIDFQEINNAGFEFIPHQTVIGVLLFMGCMGKSAQWPLSGWLPDAMEGPTPVSALIHAATMVAAGIFLLFRIHPIFNETSLLFVAVVGSITMLWGAWKAVFQTDIKKLLAYSTVSQLGLMVVGMGINAPEAAMFHLFTHAFFKAGLFLCAGVLIHALHTQNVNEMGGLKSKMPFTFWIYTLCAASLAGLPMFSGFLSKDALFLSTIYKNFGKIFLLLMWISSFLTAFYISKQWRQIFFGNQPAELSSLNDLASFETWPMKIALIPLAIGALFFCFSANPFDASNSWFFAHFQGFTLPHSYLIVGISILISLAGGYLAIRTLSTSPPSPLSIREGEFPNDNSPLLWRGVGGEVYTYITDILLPKTLKNTAQSLNNFDQKIIDGIVNWASYLTVIAAHAFSRFDKFVVDGLVNGLASTAGFLGNRTRAMQGGKIQSYFIVLFIGILLLIIFLNQL